MKVDQIQDRIVSWWWAPCLVGTAVAVPATSSTLEVVDVIGTTVPYFDVGRKRSTVWPVETRFPCNLTICHARVPPFSQPGAFVLHLYLGGHEVGIIVPSAPSNLYTMRYLLFCRIALKLFCMWLFCQRWKCFDNLHILNKREKVIKNYSQRH